MMFYSTNVHKTQFSNHLSTCTGSKTQKNTRFSQKMGGGVPVFRKWGVGIQVLKIGGGVQIFEKWGWRGPYILGFSHKGNIKI